MFIIIFIEGLLRLSLKVFVFVMGLIIIWGFTLWPFAEPLASQLGQTKEA